MKKYATVPTIIVSALFFTGMSWADNSGQDVEEDVLHGHGAVPASMGATYVQAETRSAQTGTDLLNNPQDYDHSHPVSPPAIAGADNHDDSSDLLHTTSMQH